MEKSLVTVVVCTYNRSATLMEVLEQLSVQQTGGFFDFEVIVVDNNSTDKTRDAVESFAARFERTLHYILEKRQGKPFALNTGIGKARGEYIAFTDDDVVIDHRWLLNLWYCFEKSGYDAISGRILPLYPQGTPAWVKKHHILLSGPIGLNDSGEGIKQEVDFFAGANMAVRANCLEGNDWFRCDLGYGEDTELGKRLQLMGKRVCYCGDAVVYHRVSVEKTDFRYVTSWAIRFGRYYARKGGLPVGKYFFGYPRWKIRSFLGKFSAVLSHAFDQEALLWFWIDAFKTLGQMLEYKKMRGEPRPKHRASPDTVPPVVALTPGIQEEAARPENSLAEEGTIAGGKV